MPLFDGQARWGPRRYRVITNSLGFRDATRRTVPLKAAGRRVLLLGDSFTEGIGLDYADSYAGIIASRLDREGIGVLNAGVTSYAPAIYYAKTRHLLDTVGLQVSDVVVFIDISDAEDEARYYDLHADGRVSRITEQDPPVGGETGPPDAVLPPPTLEADGHTPRVIETPLRTPQLAAAPRAETQADSPVFAALKRSSLIVRVAAAVMRWRSGDDGGELIAYPQGSPRRSLWTVDERDYKAFGRTGLERGGRDMDRLAALLHARGISLSIVVYPWPDQVLYDSASSIQVSYWRRWAGRRAVRFVDLFEPLFRDPDRATTVKQYYIAGDVHFNERGGALIAAAFLAHWSAQPS